MTKKDYSEYERTEDEWYTYYRSNHGGVIFDYFENITHFNLEDKVLHISVGMMIDQYIQRDAQRYQEENGKEDFWKSSADGESVAQSNETIRNKFSERFQMDYEIMEMFEQGFSHITGITESHPVINALSGAEVCLSLGEGVLDFVYTDFKTPIAILTKGMKNKVSTDPKTGPEKVYNSRQERVGSYMEYAATFRMLSDILYLSLYTAICPPVFESGGDVVQQVSVYEDYLSRLQQEYLEMLEFCFDEKFYPELLSDRHSAERYRIYRSLKNLPLNFKRDEKVAFDGFRPVGTKMPYGMDIQEWDRRIHTREEPTDAHRALANAYGVDVAKICNIIAIPYFLTHQYLFGSVADILSLEFEKMLEYNVRMRKCKRCGKYFIMKGNYDAHYCDRIAEGETRTCKELAAQENYKAKEDERPALKIYRKYYKRYAARVKARQIKEAEFTKWKYQALAKRDECVDGRLSVDEYIDWMEGCFPNRKSTT